MYWYVPVQDGTSRYKISRFGTSRYKLVQVSTKFLGFGTGRYKSVQDFQNRYKTAQDGTSQCKISCTGIGRYKTVQAGTKFLVQVQDGTRQYKLVPDFHSYYAYRTVQDSTSGTYEYILVCTGIYHIYHSHTIWYHRVLLCTSSYSSRYQIANYLAFSVQGGTRLYPRRYKAVPLYRVVPRRV